MIITTLMAIAATLSAEAAPVVARAEQAAPAARASRELVVCNRDQASRRAFKREYGEVKFVSARDVVDGQASTTDWSAPRCITPTEYNRLESMVGELRWTSQDRR